MRRSHTRTRQSSAPDARVPRREGDHSMQLMEAEWPLSSRRACPGCRTSSTRTILESEENVASKCASCGEARWIISYHQYKGVGMERTCNSQKWRGPERLLMRRRRTRIARAHNCSWSVIRHELIRHVRTHVCRPFHSARR